MLAEFVKPYPLVYALALLWPRVYCMDGPASVYAASSCEHYLDHKFIHSESIIILQIDYDNSEQ